MPGHRRSVDPYGMMSPGAEREDLVAARDQQSDASRRSSPPNRPGPKRMPEGVRPSWHCGYSDEAFDRLPPMRQRPVGTNDYEVHRQWVEERYQRSKEEPVPGYKARDWSAPVERWGPLVERDGPWQHPMQVTPPHGDPIDSRTIPGWSFFVERFANGKVIRRLA